MLSFLLDDNTHSEDNEPTSEGVQDNSNNDAIIPLADNALSEDNGPASEDARENSNNDAIIPRW